MSGKSSRRQRNGGGQGPAGPGPTQPPPQFPEGPRGFTVSWLNPKSKGERIGLFRRNLPADLEARLGRMDAYLRRHRTPTADWMAPLLWGAQHLMWQRDPQVGVVPFLTRGRRPQDLDQTASLSLSLAPMPQARRSLTVDPVPWRRPHILLALAPDGEFTRILATEFFGLVAVAIDRQDGPRRVLGQDLGPVSVGLRGTVLDDGVPHPDGEGIMLLDPLMLVGDYGEVEGADAEGRALFRRGQSPQKAYAPGDKPWAEFLSPGQAQFLKLWDAKGVPGYAGRIGQFHRFLRSLSEKATAEEAAGKGVPTNPVFAQALEHQLAAMRYVAQRRPFEQVSRLMASVGREERLSGLYHTIDQDIAASLERAQPYFWTADMLGLLEQLEPALEEYECGETDFAEDHGFVWFERPIQILPDDPELMVGYMWMPAQRGDEVGYALIPFTRIDHPPKGYLVNPQPFHGCPRRPQFWMLGETLTGYLETLEALYGDKAYAEGVISASGLDAETDRRQMVRWARIFAAATSLMNQRLTRISRFRGDRASRRRTSALLHLPEGLDPPTVRGVLLRRVDYVNRPAPEKEGDAVEWRYRWGVKRHWRRQWYPSEGRHKNIVIEAHIKGPADKPLRPYRPGEGTGIIGR